VRNTSDKIIIEDVEPAQKTQQFSVDSFRMPERFKLLNHLIMQDLNNRPISPTFRKYTKEEILEFLRNPAKNERKLREACINVYAFSPHFRRLIQYFTMLTDWAYVVVPFAIDVSKLKRKTALSSYNRVLKLMELFNPKSQFPRILRVCLREDVFYGTIHEVGDNVTIQRLPSDYCKISSIEGNVYNVSFDFSYFDANQDKLPFYPAEFSSKYKRYKKDRMRWIELDSPTSFAIKASDDIDTYALPPFVGVLPELYDLDDYKALKLTRTELENYAILVMKLGLDKNGNWAIDLDRARDFWQNLDSVLPDAVGSVLTPMDVEKISFDRSTSPESSAVADATSTFWDSAGVSSLLFNNSKASSNALLLSIKADQGITFGIVKNIGDMVNRYIQSKSYGRNFKVNFLDVSPYNRDEVGGQYLKMCNVGMPMVSYLAAAYGLPQADMDNLNYLEDDMLQIKERFMPLRSTNTMSSDTSGDAGRPTEELGEVSDDGEVTQERDEGE